jgi:hypothetical protein
LDLIPCLEMQGLTRTIPLPNRAGLADHALTRQGVHA